MSADIQEIMFAAATGDTGSGKTLTQEWLDSLDKPGLFRIEILASLLMIVIYALSGHCIEKFRILILHESTVGVLTGMFAQYWIVDKEVLKFDNQSFFFFLLPPIVFASAYTLKKKNFIRNIAPIFGLGILGTIVAMIVVSFILLKGNEHFRDENGKHLVYPAECLLLASVLASTDTVAVLTLITADKYRVLNSVLFGEGVVNDAVTILLYQAVKRQISGTHKHDTTDAQHDAAISGSDVIGMVGGFFKLSLLSIGLGAAFGILCSLTLKHININYDPIREMTVLLMVAYSSYLTAEQVALSGIICMFTCGLFLSHYSWYNVSDATQRGAAITINTMASISQSFLYIYMGMTAFSIEKENLKPDFIKITMIAIFVCRLFSVAVPVLLIKLCTGCKPSALSWNQWVFVYFGGLIRGAICFGLSLQFESPNRRILRTTVQVCALSLIVGVGSPLQLIAKCFSIKTDQQIAEDKKLERQQKREEKRRKRLLAAAGSFNDAELAVDANGDNDGFLAMPNQAADPKDYISGGGSSYRDGDEDGSCHHDMHLSDAESIGDAYNIIDHEFADLIEEGTYPCLLKAFIDFDKKFMLPWLLRTPELHKSEHSQSHIIEPSTNPDAEHKEKLLPATDVAADAE